MRCTIARVRVEQLENDWRRWGTRGEIWKCVVRLRESNPPAPVYAMRVTRCGSSSSHTSVGERVCEYDSWQPQVTDGSV